MAPMFFGRSRVRQGVHEPAEPERVCQGETEETPAAASISGRHCARGITMTNARASSIATGESSARTIGSSARAVNGRRTEGAVTRGQEIEIIVDGHALQAFEGESVAAALLAAGERVWRVTSRLGGPRGFYCGIGVCFDCVMTIDGRPNVRTCQTPVRAGMRVESQRGVGTWTLDGDAQPKGGPDETHRAR